MKNSIICILSFLILALPSLVGAESPKRILMVMSDRDFYDPEYTIPRAALEKLGYVIEVANVSGGTSLGINRMNVKVDLIIQNADESRYSALYIVGGYGAASLYGNTELMALARAFAASKKTIGALCYAPVVLAQAGLLHGKKATCWSTQSSLLSAAGAQYAGSVVEVSGFIVTGAGGVDLAIEIFTDAFIQNLTKAR